MVLLLTLWNSALRPPARGAYLVFWRPSDHTRKTKAKTNYPTCEPSPAELTLKVAEWMRWGQRIGAAAILMALRNLTRWCLKLLNFGEVGYASVSCSNIMLFTPGTHPASSRPSSQQPGQAVICPFHRSGNWASQKWCKSSKWQS